jgi:hypothetical protein
MKHILDRPKTSIPAARLRGYPKAQSSPEWQPLRWPWALPTKRREPYGVVCTLVLVLKIVQYVHEHASIVQTIVTYSRPPEDIGGDTDGGPGKALRVDAFLRA